MFRSLIRDFLLDSASTGFALSGSWRLRSFNKPLHQLPGGTATFNGWVLLFPHFMLKVAQQRTLCEFIALVFEKSTSSSAICGHLCAEGRPGGLCRGAKRCYLLLLLLLLRSFRERNLKPRQSSD
ncbi:unnamed protein product [Pleuronectes platessa]|uniref:Uncharacterized protein n=1 Tax=Pleuronectes platessa TaxID=8262 RepID=A0A9N7YKZ6_PLEPL|nr:unnamed protein product [Pleuronectes platessa]